MAANYTLGRKDAPTPTQIRAARKSAGLTQAEAAELIYSAQRSWQDWERGVSKMHPGLWELFQLKIKRNITLRLYTPPQQERPL